MKPLFSTLKKNYPRKMDVTQATLFNEIGWGKLIKDPNFANTCAVRVSLALVKSGVNIPGRMRIETGRYKNRCIETGQALLSRSLAQPTLFGAPEKFVYGEAEKGVAGRSGVISFWRLHPAQGDTQGHIDIVSPSTASFSVCGSNCYWGSGEVWFWPLK